MIGMNLFKQRMKEMGYSEAKLASNIDFITDILSIVAESDETLHKVFEEAIERMEMKRAEFERMEHMANDRFCSYSKMECEAEDAKREAKKAKKEAEELTRVNKEAVEQIMKPETPETRDAMRRFFIFKSACNIQSSYDNTAFIKGCAEILGNLKPAEKAEYEIDMDELLKAANIKKEKPKMTRVRY